MVSTRRTPAPPSPSSAVHLGQVRQVPEDALRTGPEVVEMRSESASPLAATAGACADKVLKEKPSGETVDKSSPAIRNVMGEPADSAIESSTGDNEVSDAPDEEPSSAVAALAQEQLRKEWQARADVKNARRARRRSRGQACELAALERKRMELQGTETGAGSEGIANDKGEGEEAGDQETPAFLPEEVLRTVEDAVGERKKSEKLKKLSEGLRKQKGTILKGRSMKELHGGIQIAIAGRKVGHGSAKSRPGRESASAFLKGSIKAAGKPRVSAAKAIRIASKRKVITK